MEEYAVGVCLIDMRVSYTMTSKSTLALLLLVASCIPARASEPVQFTDLSLKIAVESELYVLDPTADDMLQLTSLHANWREITSLSGLEYAINLCTVDLSNNKIADLSPLSGLSNLQILIANNNEIADLSALSGLRHLHHLDVHDNSISDVSPLSLLTHLTTLNIHDNQIESISALSGLTELCTLVLCVNQIHDISPLAGLVGVQELYLDNNQIADISALSAMDTLRRLTLHGNQISDISALSQLTSLAHLNIRDNPLDERACAVYVPRILADNPGIDLQHDCGPFQVVISPATGGNVTSPGEGTFTYEYGAIIVLEAAADPHFVFTGWSGDCFSTQNPAFVRVAQNYRIQANFVSTLDAIHVDDDALHDPGPGDAALSDQYENGTAEHPFDRIQEAIEVADSGATVIVRSGTYREHIDVPGRQIQLIGTDREDSNSLGWPVIDSNDRGPVVRCTGAKGSNCALCGLVITGGRGSPAGAVYCSHTGLTITNCLIVGNRSTGIGGAAIYCDNAQIVVRNCTITDNVSDAQGAGVYAVDSGITLSNSILWNNAPTDLLINGTGEVSIYYSDIAGGWPGAGNLDADPLFAKAGYWADPNDPNALLNPQDPTAVWVNGDYHLQSQAGRWDPEVQLWVQDAATSLCIDAGDVNTPVGAEPAPNGGRINVGAYAGTTEAALSAGTAQNVVQSSQHGGRQR